MKRIFHLSWGGEQEPPLLPHYERSRRMVLNHELRDHMYDIGRVDRRGCFYCGARLSKSNATLEHIIPLCRGGTNHPDNLEIACYPCNDQRGDGDWAAFYALKRGLPAPLTRPEDVVHQPTREQHHACEMRRAKKRKKKERHARNSSRIAIKQAMAEAVAMGWPSDLELPRSDRVNR